MVICSLLGLCLCSLQLCALCPQTAVASSKTEGAAKAAKAQTDADAKLTAAKKDADAKVGEALWGRLWGDGCWAVCSVTSYIVCWGPAACRPPTIQVAHSARMARSAPV